MAEQVAPPRRLTRSTTDRIVGGVCGGLADYTGIDPVVFRVVVAVATIMGGAGLLAYGLAWLVIPSAQDGPSHAETILRDRQLPRIGLVGIGVLALVIAGTFRGWGWGHDWGGGGFGLLLVVGVGLWFWFREQSGHAHAVAAPRPMGPPAPPAGEPPAATDDATTLTVTEPTSVLPPLPPTPPAAPLPPDPPPRRRRRPRSKLFGLTCSLATLTAGGLALADVAAATVLASALLVVGGGLLVGTFYGRRRGLVAVGILLTVATAVASVADVPFDGGAGDRRWRPATLATLQRSYVLGAGNAELDLRDLDLAGTRRHVRIRVGIGELQVVLPPDAHVLVQAHAGFGEVVLLGDAEDGADVTRSAERPGPDGTLVLDAAVGMGHLEVRR